MFVFAAAAAGKKGKGNRLFEFSDLQSDTFLLFYCWGCLLVHFEAELCPPRCESQGECGVGGDGPHRHHRKLWSARVSQDGADQSQLEGGGDNVEDNGIEDGGDASGSPVYRLGQGTRLTVEVEGKVQTVEVPEHLEGDGADRVLGDASEHRVAKLVESRSSQSVRTDI